MISKAMRQGGAGELKLEEVFPKIIDDKTNRLYKIYVDTTKNTLKEKNASRLSNIPTEEEARAIKSKVLQVRPLPEMSKIETNFAEKTVEMVLRGELKNDPYEFDKKEFSDMWAKISDVKDNKDKLKGILEESNDPKLKAVVESLMNLDPNAFHKALSSESAAKAIASQAVGSYIKTDAEQKRTSKLKSFGDILYNKESLKNDKKYEDKIIAAEGEREKTKSNIKEYEAGLKSSKEELATLQSDNDYVTKKSKLTELSNVDTSKFDDNQKAAHNEQLAAAKAEIEPHEKKITDAKLKVGDFAEKKGESEKDLALLEKTDKESTYKRNAVGVAGIVVLIIVIILFIVASIFISFTIVLMGFVSIIVFIKRNPESSGDTTLDFLYKMRAFFLNIIYIIF